MQKRNSAEMLLRIVALTALVLSLVVVLIACGQIRNGHTVNDLVNAAFSKEDQTTASATEAVTVTTPVAIVATQTAVATKSAKEIEEESLSKKLDFFTKQNPVPNSGQVVRLRLFLKEQIVAAFTDDGSGKFDQLLTFFPCSSGFHEGMTPVGTHVIGNKFPWGVMYDGSITQFTSQIVRDILFHSMPSYNGSINSGLSLDDFNALGQAASHGCVRLLNRDAKWIFDYCPSGTVVEIMESRGAYASKVPEKIDAPKIRPGSPSWDPTDTNAGNPYRDKEALRRALYSEDVKITVQAPKPFSFDLPAPIVSTKASNSDNGSGKEQTDPNNEEASASASATTTTTTQTPESTVKFYSNSLPRNAEP